MADDNSDTKSWHGSRLVSLLEHSPVQYRQLQPRRMVSQLRLRVGR